MNAKLWNPRGKSEEQLAVRAAFLYAAYDLERTDAQKERALVAKEKYKDAIYINSLMIGAIGIVGTAEEHLAMGLKRNYDAGATVVSVTAFAFPSDGTTPINERLDASKKVIDTNGYILVHSIDDIHRAKKEGKLGVIFNSQGADYAVDNLSQMDVVKSKGVHVSNFVYNNDNALAGGGSKQLSGVTELGKEFIKKCNEIGIVVDCSHSSNQTAIDAARLTKKPMVASHSNPSALMDLGRNLSDEAIEAVGSTNGVVCSVGVGLFMNKEGDSSPEQLITHILHTANLIGKDKVGYATDYMHCAEEMFKGSVSDAKVFPPEKGFGAPATNIATEHVWDVVAILEDKHNWTDTEIKGFLGENLMRVYKANWK